MEPLEPTPPARSRAARFAVVALVVAALGAGALLWVRYLEQQRAEREEAAFRAAVLPNDMLTAADPKRGENMTKGCNACHSFGKGEAHKLGPNLWGIVGREAASAPGYEYSPALAALAGQVWTTEELAEWFRDPQAYAPGTKMTFGGMGDPQDRMDLISYLMTLRDSNAQN